ncbi:soul heme-binding [Seminavis robusta]|uniref:Soul heme-binding n=1 Tax=Seminavis robusta TaxID=568900 RepID=A0A9N8HFN1_9STRA|nr:soul heme-binding [Seminavis robusta]|eukprot:Sro463_g148290.1 soul heme-binding (400) ;mRNA; r:55193-56478
MAMPKIIVAVLALAAVSQAFLPHRQVVQRTQSSPRSLKIMASATTTELESSVSDLKRVLEREYISFFDPMERDYYSPTVSFEDPMTALAGVDAYQNNVDMLASRTLMGKLLFQDAGIVLHSVEGGEISQGTKIDDIITRWTLRVTAKVLPWSPTARFSGVSVYQVVPGGPKGVMVEHQTDYWDSINIQPGTTGDYQKVDKSVAVKDFLNQLKPENAIAPPSAPELPYQLLRRGNGYEVRQYPSYSSVKMSYERRDLAFEAMGSFTRGMTALAPAIMSVEDDSSKSMTWPLEYAPPGQSSPPEVTKAVERAEDPRFQAMNCQVETFPSQVIAVGSFSDAILEPVVRKADRLLREALDRDGLRVEPGTDSRVTFAQYDAVYSMGKRRGEVWIPLKDGGHPW